MPATKKNAMFGLMGKSKVARLEESDPSFVRASSEGAAKKLARVSGGEVVKRGGKWGVLSGGNATNPKSVKEMSAAEINKALDKLSQEESKVTAAFIAAGRGHERPSEYLKKDDPLARKAKALFDRRSELSIEVEMRAGPGVYKLPKGFGPRKTANPDSDKNIASESQPLHDEAYGSEFYKKNGNWYRRLSFRSPGFNGKAGEKFGPWTKVPRGHETATMERVYKAGRLKNPAKKSKKKNPENEAEGMFKSFHGLPSEETVEFKRKLHFHENVAALGELVELRVELRNGREVNIGFEGTTTENPRRKSKAKKRKNPIGDITLLCTNEKGTQLFIEGGDQKVNLNDFNLKDTEQKKESVVLGTLTHITYHTTKVFDGKEETYDYIHKMGEKGGIPPTLLYDVANRALSISGGTYVINKPLLSTSPGIEN